MVSPDMERIGCLTPSRTTKLQDIFEDASLEESPKRIDGFPDVEERTHSRRELIEEHTESLSQADILSIYGDDESIQEDEDSNKDAEELTNLAIELQGRGQHEEALDLYLRALQKARADLLRVKRCISKKQRGKHLHGQLRELATEMEGTIADIHYEMGIVYELGEKYDEAKTSCWEALHVYAGAGQMEYAQSVQRKLELIESARQTKQERQDIHRKASDLARRVPFVTDPEVKSSIKKNIIETLREALQLERTSLGQEHPLVAETMIKIGAWYFEQDMVDQALQQMLPAVALLESSVGPYHPLSGRALSCLASVYSDEQRWEEALTHYQRALVAQKASTEGNFPRIGATLYHLGIAFFQLNRNDESMEAFSDALLSYAGTTGMGIHPDTAHVWVAMGHIYGRRKEWEDAVISYANALAVVRDMHQISTKGSSVPRECIVYRGYCSVMNNDFLSETLEYMASAEEKLCRYGEALEKYEKALRIQKNFYFKNPCEERQIRIATITHRMGQVQQSSGKLDEAVELYGESLGIRRQMKSAQVETALVLKDIASIHLIRRTYELAVANLEEALHVVKDEVSREDVIADIRLKLSQAREKIPPPFSLASISERSKDDNSSLGSRSAASRNETRTIVKDDGSVATSVGSVSVATSGSVATRMEKKADRLQEKGDYGRALEGYSKALDVRRSKSKKKPDKDQRKYIARNLCRIAAIHEKEGSTVEAEMMYMEAMQIYKSTGATEKDPLVEEIAMKLESMRFADI